MANMMPHARERGKNPGKKVLKSLELARAANGGHIVTHRYESSTGEYHEPEQHTFGKDEGQKVLDHVSKHMGIESGGDGDENEY